MLQQVRVWEPVTYAHQPPMQASHGSKYHTIVKSLCLPTVYLTECIFVYISKPQSFSTVMVNLPQGLCPMPPALTAPPPMRQVLVPSSRWSRITCSRSTCTICTRSCTWTPDPRIPPGRCADPGYGPSSSVWGPMWVTAPATGSGRGSGYGYSCHYSSGMIDFGSVCLREWYEPQAEICELVVYIFRTWHNVRRNIRRTESRSTKKLQLLTAPSCKNLMAMYTILHAESTPGHLISAYRILFRHPHLSLETGRSFSTSARLNNIMRHSSTWVM